MATSEEQLHAAVKSLTAALGDFTASMQQIEMRTPEKILERTTQLSKIEKVFDSLGELRKKYEQVITSERESIREYVQQQQENLARVMNSLGVKAPMEAAAPKTISVPSPTSSSAATSPNTLAISNGNGYGSHHAPTAGGWAGVVAAKSTHVAASTHVHVPPSPVMSPRASTAGLSTIQKPSKVTEYLDIPAVIIERLEECHRCRGYWCYYPQRDVFALSINGQILTAYLTDVLPAKEKPRKFDVHRNCYENIEVDPSTTNYFVPARYCPNSKDHRILTNRMQVRPASARDDADRYSIRAGGRDTLHLDLPLLRDDDVDLIGDIAGHFLLVWQVLMQNRSKNRV